ncbi:C-type lectin, mannose-binding protein [Anopheles darlingi]|uniref:C-type lectin, mannose-binding protein n=1 Tax=Anopheles darlingi TaxID=43151 RepID=W5J9X0_ANODA|nr:C-type lectin 37Db-like [Anopheles darlingi]ETN61257.1 C-type lectin, mannose-binding protein [Anopheles darlingi]
MAKLRFLVLCAIVLGVLAPQFSQADGDNTFAVFRQKSYYFSNSFKLNWFKAMEYCRTRGMHLLSVRNPQERDAVIEYLDSTGFTNTHNHRIVWISANDLGEEGEFHWATTGERLMYSNWAPGEPNNAKVAECTFEDCVVMEYSLDLIVLFNNTFDDRDCQREYHFICETLLE